MQQVILINFAHVVKNRFDFPVPEINRAEMQEEENRAESKAFFAI